MTAFLAYNLKAAAIIVVLFMFYRLLLSKETLHRLNRVILMLIPVIGYAVPAGWITLTKKVILPLGIDSSVAEAPVEPIVVDLSSSHSLLPVILTGVYLAGALVVAVRTIHSVHSIRSLIKEGEVHEYSSGIRIAVVDKDITPMSWGRYIILSKEDYGSETSSEEESGILLHEAAHVRMNHSADILCLSPFLCFQWFNPAIWMLRSDLKEVHEYLSDEKVILSGIDPRQYQLMLVKKAMASVGYTLANSFSHSSLTKRITMMLKKRSINRKVWAKTLAFLPVLTICLFSTARTRSVYVPGDNSFSFDPDTTRIIVRPSTADLVYVYDGIEISSEVFSMISPSDISSIEVFKDAEDCEKILGRPIGSKQGLIVLFSKENKSLDALKKKIAQVREQSKQNPDAKSVSVFRVDDGTATIITEKTERNDQDEGELVMFRPVPSVDVVIMINGKEESKEVMDSLDPSTIESITVIKDKTAAEAAAGRPLKDNESGAVLITLKKTPEKQTE